MVKTQLIGVFKALSNSTRMQILEWLKEPDKNFKPNTNGVPHDDIGVCVTIIRDRVGLSQSTVSNYMSTLEKAGLTKARRVGQYTFYMRNEPRIDELGRQFQQL